MRRTAVIVIALHIATAAYADPKAMTNVDISAAIPGAKLEIDTPLGTTIPVSYSIDGKMTGEAGDLASYLGAKSDHGHWWVARNKLCNKWETWLDSKINCLTLEQDGQKIFWRREDGEAGTATLIAAPPPAPTTETPRYALGGPQDAVTAQPAAVIEAAPAIIAQTEPVAAVETKPKIAAALLDAPVAKPKSIKRMATKTLKKPSKFEPTFWVAGVDPRDVLNVRSGPSADHPVVATLAPGSHGIRIVGACSELWCHIKLQKAEGWVNRSYLVYEIPETKISAAAR